jgi:hypothetical protein
MAFVLYFIAGAIPENKGSARTSSRAHWLSLLEVVMTLNEGTIDRAVRVVFGLALLSLVFVGPHSMLGLLGLIPLATGIVGYCPLYRLIGIRTRALET